MLPPQGDVMPKERNRNVVDMEGLWRPRISEAECLEGSGSHGGRPRPSFETHRLRDAPQVREGWRDASDRLGNQNHAVDPSSRKIFRCAGCARKIDLFNRFNKSTPSGKSPQARQAP